MFGRVIYSAVSHCGKRRSSNEDALLCDREVLQGDSIFVAEKTRPLLKRALFLVADGMGGYSHGAVASRLASEWFGKNTTTLSTKEAISDAVNEINRKLFREMKADRALERMGTTIAGAAFAAERCSYFNVGDSRVYLFRDGVLTQLSTDDPRGVIPLW